MEEQIYRNCTIQIRESLRFKSYYWEIFKGRVAIGDNSKSYGCDTRERALSEARDYVDWWLLDSEDTTTQGTMQEAVEKQPFMYEITSGILEEVLDERRRQDEKFGEMPRNLTPAVWLTVLTEELGEVARAIIEGDSENYREELIQVCAVALAALQDIAVGSPVLDIQHVNPQKTINYQNSNSDT